MDLKGFKAVRVLAEVARHEQAYCWELVFLVPSAMFFLSFKLPKHNCTPLMLVSELIEQEITSFFIIT